MGSVFSFLKQSPIKLILIFSIVTSLIGFSTWGYNKIYQSGYNAAILEVKEASDIASEKHSKAISARLDKVIAEYQEKLKQAERASEELLRRNNDVKIKEVIKIVESSSCKRLDGGIISLFNQYQGDKPNI